MIKIFLYLGLIIGLIILGPLFTIWALNTVFGLGIAYTFWTWLGVLWLTATLGASSISKK